MNALHTSELSVSDLLIAASREVPEEVLASARLHFLDALGVGILAAVHGPVAGITQMSAESDQAACTVLGRNLPATPSMAALINGTLIHSLEFDDTHVASVMHGSSVIAPTALAGAESVGASITELMRAFAIGWEFLIRIGLASPGRIQANGYQITSAGGAFAAAAVTSLLRKDSADLMSNAIGIAGSQASGTFAFLSEGNTVKAAQPGWAAHAGILARDLARAGVGGPTDVFRGRFGFYSLYARDPDGGQRLLDSTLDLGERWHLPEAAFKLVPSCHYIHPFVEAISQAIDSGIDVSELENVHCWVPAEVTGIIAEPWSARIRPAQAHDARWSLPYVLAAVLIDGDVNVELFAGECREDVMQLAARMSCESWNDSGYPRVFPARIRLRNRDGSSREFLVPDVKGGAGRPIEPSDVVSKAHKNLTAAGWPVQRIERLTEVILNQEHALIEELSQVLRYEQPLRRETS